MDIYFPLTQVARYIWEGSGLILQPVETGLIPTVNVMDKYYTFTGN